MVTKGEESLGLVDKKYKLVPPDGGWGYLVAIAAVINFSTTTAFGGCFGMLYDDFITKNSMTSANVTLLAGIFFVSVALAGFFTSALLRIMSMRKLAFVASIIFSCGTFGTVIMTKPFMFFLSAGMFQGVGLGIIFNLSCTILNDYFLHKRVFIMNSVQTVTGFNAMIAPIFVKWALQNYGSQGTLLFIAGISLNNFFAAMIMQPVQWHMKKVEVSDTTELKLMLEEMNEVKKVSTPVVNLTDLEENVIKTVSEKMPKLDEVEKKKSGVRKVLESLIDPSLLKTVLFSCVSFGPAMCTSADGIFMFMVPQYLYSIAWSQENVAMSLTLYGFGDLAMRVILTIISKWMYKIGVQKIYIAGIAIAILSRLGMLSTSSVILNMVCFTFMGVAHCSIAVLMPVVISELVPPEKFTSAMGIGLLLTGSLSIGVGPAVGAIRDFTDSYVTAFYTTTLLYAIIFVLWPIEMVLRNKKQRRKSSQLNKVNK